MLWTIWMYQADLYSEEEHKSLKIARIVAKTLPQHAICKLYLVFVPRRTGK